MKCNSATKAFTVVVQLVITLTGLISGVSFAVNAWGNTDAQKQDNNELATVCGPKMERRSDPDCQRILNSKYPDPTETRCDKLGESADKAVNDFNKSCSSARLGKNKSECLETARTCDPEYEFGDEDDPSELLSGTDLNMGALFGGQLGGPNIRTSRNAEAVREAQENYCEKMRSAGRCAALAAAADSDYQAYGRALDKSVDHAQDNLDRILEKQQQSEKSRNERLMSLQRQRQELDEKARSDDVAMRQRVQDQTIQIQAQKLKAVQEAQKSIEDLDDQVIKLDSALAQAQSAVANAQDQVYVECRKYAAREFQKVEAERKERLKKEAALLEQGLQRNQAITALAGYQTRSARNNAAARLADYNAFFNDCQSDKAPEGAEAKARAVAAQRAAQTATNEMNVRRQQLAQRRAFVQQQILAQDAINQQVIANEDAKNQQNYALMTQSYQSRVQSLSQEMMQMQQQSASESASTQNQWQRAYQRLEKAQADSSKNSLQQSCAKRPGSPRASADVLAAIQSAGDNYDLAKRACSNYTNRCSGSAQANAGIIEGCKTLMSIQTGRGDRSRPRDSESGRVSQ